MLTEIAPRFGTLALLLAAGLGLSRLIPTVRELRLPVRLGYSYLLGVAWTGCGLFALSHLAAMPLRRGVVLMVVAPPAILGGLELVRALARRPLGRKAPRARSLALLLFGGALTIFSLSLLVQAVSYPLTDWDGRMTWSTQARYMSAAASASPPILTNPDGFISHPQYPPLLPLCQVAAVAIAGSGADWDERAFRPLYAAFFPALLLIVYDSARRWVGNAAAAWAGLTAALIPCIAFGGEGGATSAYSDLPLACFWGAGLMFLLRARARLSDAIAGGIFLAAAVLTKNEGVLLATAALTLAACQAVARRRQRSAKTRWMHLAAALIPVVAATILLHWWRSGIPNRFDEAYFEGLQPLELAVRSFTGAKALVPLLLAKMANPSQWSLFWWAAPVLLVAGHRGLLRPPASRLMLAILAPLAIGWAAYARHWDPAYLLGVTWDRLLVQSSVPLFMLLAFVLRAVFSDLRRNLSRAGSA